MCLEETAKTQSSLKLLTAGLEFVGISRFNEFCKRSAPMIDTAVSALRRSTSQPMQAVGYDWKRCSKELVFWIDKLSNAHHSSTRSLILIVRPLCGVQISQCLQGVAYLLH